MTQGRAVDGNLRRRSVPATKAITHRASIITTNAGQVASGSFTPDVGDLIFAFGSGATVQGVTPTIAADVGSGGNNMLWMTFTYVSSITPTRAGTDDLHFFIGNQLVPLSTSDQTMTLLYNAGAGSTGSALVVGTVAGMSKTGLAALRQSGGSNGASGVTPAVTFGGAVLTTNPTVVCIINSTNPATVTPPTNFTEQLDSGYASPTRGLEYATRLSGHTATSITYGAAASPTAWAMIAAEFNTA